MKKFGLMTRQTSLCLGSLAGLATIVAASITELGATPAQAASSLTGQQLYALHCARCHTERYATERTDAQWKTVMLHMQVRASLNGADAKKITEYLQASNK